MYMQTINMDMNTMLPGVQARTQETDAHSQLYTAGTSVLAIKYRDGVMLASDTQASYGSYAKYKGVQRVAKITNHILFGSSGEYSNHQNLTHLLRVAANPLTDEESIYGARECFEILRNHMYGQRCRGQPEMNFHIVAGVNDYPRREPVIYEYDRTGRFLAGTDRLGNFFHSNVMAAGIGAHIALPILRDRLGNRDQEVTEEEARSILKAAMTALVYRDTRASPWIQISKVTKEGAEIGEIQKLQTSWSIGANSK